MGSEHTFVSAGFYDEADHAFQVVTSKAFLSFSGNGRMSVPLGRHTPALRSLLYNMSALHLHISKKKTKPLIFSRVAAQDRSSHAVHLPVAAFSSAAAPYPCPIPVCYMVRGTIPRHALVHRAHRGRGGMPLRLHQPRSSIKKKGRPAPECMLDR
jgi:hypothetical protein